MVEKYTPKVGDKVRATLGENVLVGIVQSVATEFVRVDPGENVRNYFSPYFADGWQFEQIVSVPSKFGAVIRRADGEVFVMTASPGRKFGADWLTGSGERWADEGRATAGGFTVLFDGVDE